jgi:LCP family protein required for cell wall assembly
VSDRKTAVPAGRWENLEALGRAVDSRGPAGAPPRRNGNRSSNRARGRRARRLAVFALAILLVVALVGLFLGWRFVSGIVSRNAQSVENLAPAKGVNNFLLVGSDTREGLSPEELRRVGTQAVDGQRTDTIILVHVSPRNKKAVMVSIPRDLKVDIPGHGINKINAAYAFGGPALLVKTIEQNLGIPVNHYAEVDFAGFLKVVDAVGGVRLCNQTGHPLNDSFANLHMAPGCHHVNGVQALAFVRARHIDSDFGRISRQQQFLRAVMSKVSSAGNLVNIPKLVSIANIVADHMKTDDTLKTSEAIGLVRRLGRLDPGTVDMRVYPSAPNGPSFVEALPEAPLLMKALADDSTQLPPVGLPSGKGVTLASVRVTVLNGGGVQGAAAQAAESLHAYGLQIAGTGNATKPTGSASVLTYPPAQAQQARLLAALLGDQVRLAPSSASGPSDTLTLTVGSAFHLAPPPGG